MRVGLCKYMASVTFGYCTVEDYNKEVVMLEKWCEKTQALCGTQKIHHVFYTSDRSVLKSRYIQLADIVHLQEEAYEVEDRQFIICKYDKKLCVCVCTCVLFCLYKRMAVKFS